MKRVSAAAFLAWACLAPAVARAQDAAGEYTVQEGDTLWDISARALRDPWLWPKIWEFNKENIKDPHWIYPGQKIRVSPLQSEPPAVPEPATLKAEPPAVAEPAQSPQAAPSQPLPEFQQDAGSIEDLGARPRKDGKIAQGSEGKIIMEPGDEVTLRLRQRAAVHEGTRLTVYRRRDSLIEPSGEASEDDKTVFEVLGTIRVLRVLQPGKALGEIERVVGPLEVGDLVKVDADGGVE